MDNMDVLCKMLSESDNIAFLGGAGVSTESGIPDFRSENGIFKALEKYRQPPEVLLSHSFFMKHTDAFYTYYRENLLLTDVEPNKAHKALAELERMGRLKAVVTQNIDGLHQKAGSKNVLELHGSIYRNHCMDCGASYDAAFMLSTEGIPRCPKCGGIVKPDVVLYEEGLDQRTLRLAVAHIASADMLIVGGTSLAVYPAAGLIDYYSGEKLALINRSETPYDGRADLIINDSIGKVLSEAVSRLN